MDTLQSKLDERVRQVRLSGRLTSSPACLVVADQDMSPNLEKLMNQAKGESTKQKRIMEINPDHEIVVKMRDRLKQDAADPLLDDYANILYGYALARRRIRTRRFSEIQSGPSPRSRQSDLGRGLRRSRRCVVGPGRKNSEMLRQPCGEWVNFNSVIAAPHPGAVAPPLLTRRGNCSQLPASCDGVHEASFLFLRDSQRQQRSFAASGQVGY